MERQNEVARVAISGPRGSGKTSLLMNLVKMFRRHNLKVQGVLEAGIFDGDKKVAIEAMDLAVGESRMLAQLSTEATSDLQFGDWTFFQETFEWANERLAKVDATDVFILDEIGPLELDQGRGLQTGLEVMSSSDYRMGIMSLRPKCLDAVMVLFPDLVVYSLPIWKNELLLNELFRIANIV